MQKRLKQSGRNIERIEVWKRQKAAIEVILKCCLKISLIILYALIDKDFRTT